MAVWCRQTVDGEPAEPFAIDAEAHPDLGGDDMALLRRKADGAIEKGWTVTWTGERSFSAEKVRWGGSLCIREVWAD